MMETLNAKFFYNSYFSLRISNMEENLFDWYGCFFQKRFANFTCTRNGRERKSNHAP